MKQDFKISIPNPCTEDWGKMSPDGQGKFCVSCQKIVVDFTHMSTDEIKDYFLSHRNQKTCGHFKTYQLETEKNEIQKYLIKLYSRAYLNLKRKSARLLVLSTLGFVMTLAGCNGHKSGESLETTGDSTVVYPHDSLTKDVTK
jgi:hypothetical protein